jgi:hypothetical protein
VGAQARTRARALSFLRQADNPKGPCKWTVKIPGEQANTKTDRSCRVQSAECRRERLSSSARATSVKIMRDWHRAQEAQS